MAPDSGPVVRRMTLLGEAGGCGPVQNEPALMTVPKRNRRCPSGTAWLGETWAQKGAPKGDDAVPHSGGLGRVHVPRLIAANADLHPIAFPPLSSDGIERLLRLPDAIDRLDALVAATARSWSCSIRLWPSCPGRS